MSHKQIFKSVSFVTHTWNVGSISVSCESDMIAWPTELQHQLGEKEGERERDGRERWERE